MEEITSDRIYEVDETEEAATCNGKGVHDCGGVSPTSSSDQLDGTDGKGGSGRTSKALVPSSLPLLPDKNMKPRAKNCFRLVILGSSRVGKTSLVSR